MQQQNQSRLVSVTEAAQIIGSTPATLNRWRIEGRHLAYSKIGRNVRYDVAVLEEFVKQRQVKPELNESEGGPVSDGQK